MVTKSYKQRQESFPCFRDPPRAAEPPGVQTHKAGLMMAPATGPQVTVMEHGQGQAKDHTHKTSSWLKQVAKGSA